LFPCAKSSDAPYSLKPSWAPCLSKRELFRNALYQQSSLFLPSRKLYSNTSVFTPTPRRPLLYKKPLKRKTPPQKQLLQLLQRRMQIVATEDTVYATSTTDKESDEFIRMLYKRDFTLMLEESELKKHEACSCPSQPRPPPEMLFYFVQHHGIPTSCMITQKLRNTAPEMLWVYLSPEAKLVAIRDLWYWYTILTSDSGLSGNGTKTTLLTSSEFNTGFALKASMETL
jgi:hypothetical protein